MKFAYRVDQEENPTSIPLIVPWQKIWRLKASGRLKMLLWRIRSNSLPIKEKLMLRLGSNDTLCHLCESELESCFHLFFKCPVARVIWLAGRWDLRLDTAPINSCEDIIKVVTEPSKHCYMGNNSTKKKHLGFVYGFHPGCYLELKISNSSQWWPS